MAKRVAYTLLFLKSDMIARADFGPLPRLEQLGFWQKPQSGNARLYYSIESALEFGGKCGRDVWVIGEEFWTQSLSIPLIALGGLDREQITKVIGFDVEALTGVPGSASSIGFSKAAPSDDSEHFWVTQISSTEEAQIQSAIEAAGGRLAGVVHPGGVPAPISANGSSNGQTWRRIEVWKETTFCIFGRETASQNVRVINGDIGNDTWRAALSRWITSNDAEISEWLGPQAISQPLANSREHWTALPTLSGDALKNWLMQWAKELTSGAEHVPLVEARSLSSSVGRRIAISTLVALICLGACIARGAWLKHQQANANEELRLAQAPGKELADLQKQVEKLQADLSRRRAQTASMPHPVTYDPATVDRQRHRIAELLSALSQQANENLIINRVAPQAAGVISIEGQCMPATAVDQFVQHLAEVLPSRGWTVAPAEKMSNEADSVDGLCKFTLKVSISPTIPAEVSAPLVRHGGGR